jgi:hypothetical protein
MPARGLVLTTVIDTEVAPAKGAIAGRADDGTDEPDGFPEQATSAKLKTAVSVMLREKFKLLPS